MERARIRILEPETAKRIAAGEVIDRPAAALRELLDNALDAGATGISVELEGGGVELLRVADDGCGMDRDDLSLSVLPHATSKIRVADDLLSLSTLGFRGEALASIAAVAELEISSAVRDDEAWRLSSRPGREPKLEPWRGSRGTVATVRGLFESFPARKKFLKRPSSEAAACRQVFVDKALPFPSVSFRLSSGGKPLLTLPGADPVGRVLAACAPDQPAVFWRELVAEGPGFSARIVAALPDIYRTDRKQLQVFVNRRRVQEYGIAQAIEYAYRGALPGGAWPYAYAFIDVDPSLADFNIHPAKKEVRLRNLDDIRGGVIGAIRSWLGDRSRLASAGLSLPMGDRSADTGSGADADAGAGDPLFPGFGYDRHPGDAASVAGDELMERPEGIGSAWRARIMPQSHGGQAGAEEPPAGSPAGSATVQASGDGRGFRYLGQALGVFLVAEMDGELLLLDMHAAHERMLFDDLMAGKVPSQELLVPVVYEPESAEEERWLEAHAGALATAGFRLERDGPSWLLLSVPSLLSGGKTGAAFELIRSRPEPAELLREAAATVACRSAVMDGDSLDERTARELIGRALRLPDQRCPHGRPIWVRLGRDELYRAVRRLV